MNSRQFLIRCTQRTTKTAYSLHFTKKTATFANNFNIATSYAQQT